MRLLHGMFVGVKLLSSYAIDYLKKKKNLMAQRNFLLIPLSHLKE